MNKNSINFLWASSRRLLEELSIVHSMLLDTNTRRSFGTRCLQGLLPTRSVRTMDIPHICRWSNMEFFMEKAKQQQEYTLVCSCDEWFVSLAAGRRQGNTSFHRGSQGLGRQGLALLQLRSEPNVVNTPDRSTSSLARRSIFVKVKLRVKHFPVADAT